ncbi:MAG: type II/IV secretion system ATPase subunit [Halobacteriales archaeon]|nr:type II/IV secretion system ATPase subunit [Halobacteriales archaeon]
MSEQSKRSFSTRISDLMSQLNRTAEMLRGSRIGVENFKPNEHGSLVEYEPSEGLEEVERYWTNAPYAFVAIEYDNEENTHFYRVIEPVLDHHERELLDTLLSDIRDSLIYREGNGAAEPSDVLQEQIRDLLEEYGVEIDLRSFYKLYYYLYRSFQGFGRIDPIMHDSHVEDVSCDGYDIPVFVYHDKYRDIETNIVYGEDELDNFVGRLAQQSGRHISIGDPMIEATLPDGSRAELAYGREVTPRGSAFTIRQYAEEPFTPVDLIKLNTFDADQMAYLWLAIENNMSLIFAGGTASGKTTALNAVSMFIPPRSKVLSIEDTRELALYHDNWLSSVTRERMSEGRNITMYDLLRSALRHRPEYIIVGEIRGDEAITLFQAMNTGHTTLSTMHADSVQTVINRLENEPLDVPRAMIQSLDMLAVQRLTYVEGERVRRNNAIAEIRGIDQRTGDLDYATAYQWESGTDSFRYNDSSIVDDIQERRGWSRTDLLRELRNRKRILTYLLERDVTDYRQFTAVINEYYADKDRVLDRVSRHLDREVTTTMEA